MKKLLLYIMLFVIFLLLSPPIKAQSAEGYYRCHWGYDAFGHQTCTQLDFCNEGYIPGGNECEGRLPQVCPDYDETGAEITYTCVNTDAEIGWKCDQDQKACLVQCQYGVDVGCNYNDEATCNTECSTTTQPGATFNCDTSDFSCPTIPNETGQYPSKVACLAHCGTSGDTDLPFDCVTLNGNKGVDSAIGCIPRDDLLEMLEFWFRWGIGLAGGFSFLLIIYSTFLIMTSTGDPKKIQAGRELFISAITGLVFLVFTVFMLRLIGVDILHIPGWGV